ncbi:MAG: hypothetical protein KJ889_09710 [Gammaproteobacteria bacterium]|nr:hypothetical protein [Gammaproteobacteria bacterium]
MYAKRKTAGNSISLSFNPSSAPDQKNHPNGDNQAIAASVIGRDARRTKGSFVLGKESGIVGVWDIAL